MNASENFSTQHKKVLNDKKLFIETYGCQMNVADSEVVAAIMQMHGYSLCNVLEEADAVLSILVLYVIMLNRKFYRVSHTFALSNETNHI